MNARLFGWNQVPPRPLHLVGGGFGSIFRMEMPPSTDLIYDADRHLDSLQAILAALIPGARGCTVQATAVPGGITNQLFKCEIRTADGQGGAARDPVLVRVFGGEGMIDRARDNAVVVSLSKADLGPSCYGTFGNGRVEEFLSDCRTLEVRDLSDAETSRRIAVEMARIHLFQPPDEAVGSSREPGLWKQLWEWHRQAMAVTFPEGSNEAAELARIPLQDAEREIRLQQDRVPDSYPVVFCNNDLLCGNIMQHTPTGKMHLIDFEYGGMNYRGFDIANHFNEMAGGTDNGTPDYSLFPSREHMRMFCTAYLEKYGGKTTVDQLLEEVDIFVLLDHWYWGIWAINMASSSGCDEFPYLRFAGHRIAQYFVERNAQGSSAGA